MFIALSKIVDLAAGPLTWVLALLALALATRRPRARVTAAALALVLLWAASTPVVANRLAAAIEGGAVETARPDVAYDVVVVLSGAVDAAASRASGHTELMAAADRITAAFELLREGRARVALLSGGPVTRPPGEAGEAALAARLLARWGIDPARLLVEDESRNTHENAVAAVRILRQRAAARVLLVTSAAHLPRALGCFRREGLVPDALPVDRRAGAESGVQAWLPRAGELAQTSEMLHELAGRLAYWVMGYTA
ncbi:MAG TPA: YdcF family protein [Anaeromyxobacteraceae bacterium]|nr:YdcF family protein [Anaeromyxobacteraceae bacterium]